MKRFLRSFGKAGRWFFRTRRRGVLTTSFLVLLIAVGVVVHALDAPAEGHSITATDKLTTVETPAKSAETPAQKVTSNYFTLSLPPGYNVQNGAATPANLLYNQTITKAGDFGSLIIAIGLQQLPSGGLSGDSSYALRSQQSSVYQMSTQVVSGDTVHIASDADSSSVVAFWPHGSYLATVSISSSSDGPSSDNNSDEISALQPVFSNWQWR